MPTYARIANSECATHTAILRTNLRPAAQGVVFCPSTIAGSCCSASSTPWPARRQVQLASRLDTHGLFQYMSSSCVLTSHHHQGQIVDAQSQWSGPGQLSMIEQLKLHNPLLCSSSTQDPNHAEAYIRIQGTWLLPSSNGFGTRPPQTDIGRHSVMSSKQS